MHGHCHHCRRVTPHEFTPDAYIKCSTCSWVDERHEFEHEYDLPLWNLNRGSHAA